ncbi:hypothetical protein [Saliphagus sp. LR7]|uniref:HVO_0234 family beta-propeller protein n=1 Tax=Saliphagus sp. LR7 TaxID=2282654 RepID=UPI000DF7FE83|nr:hypothetical protein [Saliphagus sp. LR7]
MSTIDEKRVYGDRAGADRAYVAGGVGLLSVSIAGGSVGEFGLRRRGRARDVATAGGQLAVATDDALLLADRGVAGGDPDLEETGFGPATRVGVDGERVIAVGPDGRVAHLRGGEWTTLGDAREVRGIDGDLVATADGVLRVQGEGLEPAGLDDARDVSAAGIPLAATGDGLYALGNGWLRSLEGPFDVVGADPASEPGSLARAHAAACGRVYEHADGDWHDRGEAPGQVAGFAYGERAYAVTEDGEFLAGESGETVGEWRSHPLGVPDVGAVALAGPESGVTS